MDDKYLGLIDQVVHENDGPGPDFIAGWLVGGGHAKTRQDAEAMLAVWLKRWEDGE